MTAPKTCRFFAALLVAALACLALASPAAALDINPADYFRLTYEPITFDKSQVAPGEVFHTTIRGRATCDKDIPLPVNRATITSRVVARQAATGANYAINPGFTIDIDPFPGEAGETFEINETLSLRFPTDTPPGDYQIVGELIQARAKIAFFWTDVTGSLPDEQAMGKVTVIPAPPSTAAPAPQATTTITTSRPPPPAGLPLWVSPVIVIVIIAVIITVIILLVRRRR